jgi:hypothetical protein
MTKGMTWTLLLPPLQRRLAATAGLAPAWQ